MIVSLTTLVLGTGLAVNLCHADLGIPHDEMETLDESSFLDEEATPRHAYLLVMGRNLDQKSLKKYNESLPGTYTKFGGEYLAVEQNVFVIEGSFDFETLAISRWPSIEAIHSYWDSPDFEEVKRLREGFGDFKILAVEGLPEAK